MIQPKVFSFSCACLVALLLLVAPAFAEPTLVPIDTLPTSIQENATQTFRFRYRDPNGDRIRKATFTDRASSATTKIPATILPTDDTSKGVEIDWTVKSLEAGEHHSEFTVETAAQTVRYPLKPEDTYDFGVEKMMVKWAIFAGGVLVGLMFLPFLVYALSRSMNQRGDPTKAARGALLLGILMCGALFIWLFAGTFGFIGVIIAAIAALALIVMVLTRR